MTHTNFAEAAKKLEAQIAEAGPAGRAALQPELSKLVQMMREGGQVVPRRICQLDTALTEERIEAQFDNLPV